MEVLLWLLPPVVVTLVAMVSVGWLGRAGRGRVDRDEAVRRLGAALEGDRDLPPAPAPERERERSTGVALRRTRRRASPDPQREAAPGAEPERRAS